MSDFNIHSYWKGVATRPQDRYYYVGSFPLATSMILSQDDIFNVYEENNYRSAWLMGAYACEDETISENYL